MSHRDSDPKGTDPAVQYIWHLARNLILLAMGALLGAMVMIFWPSSADSAENACAHTPYVYDRTVRMGEFFEGFRPIVELDTSGDMVIGYGHSYGLFPDEDADLGDVSPDYARIVLMGDLLDAQDAVCSHVAVPLSDDQLDALTLFVMNVGEGAFASSTLLRVVNADQMALVPRELTRWVHDKAGHVLLGLARRRVVEGALFTGVHVDTTKPLW
jgi:GH24 family phage-related lysozyme (muramidase)